MSAINASTSQAHIKEIQGEVDALCEETRGEGNLDIDQGIINRIKDVVAAIRVTMGYDVAAAMRMTIGHYRKSPLLQEIMETQLSNCEYKIRCFEQMGQKWYMTAPLPPIRRILKSLTFVNVDPDLAKALADANVPAIIQKVEAFLKTNPLEEGEREPFICDLVDPLIHQDKLQEAIDTGQAFLGVVNKPLIRRLLKADRFIKAIPLLFKKCPNAITKIQQAQKIMEGNSDFFLSDNHKYTLSKSLLLQTIFDAGVDPSSGIEWCFPGDTDGDNKRHHFRGPIGPQNGLPILIYNGANVNKLKADMNQCWAPYTKCFFPVMDKASQIYEEVCKQYHQFFSTTVFQLLVKEEALENIPKDLKRIIISYLPDRSEIAELCLDKERRDYLAI